MLGWLTATPLIAGDRVCPEPDRDVVPIELIQPPYPGWAARFCIEGSVSFEFTIDAGGQTTDVEVTESHPAGVFDIAAEILRHWRFEPRCIDGRPVERRAVQTIDFTLPPEAREWCPDIDDSELMAGLTAVAALYREFGDRREHADFRPLVAAAGLSDPYAEIEAAHRAYLDRQLELAAEHHLPGDLIDPIALARRVELLDDGASGVVALRDAVAALGDFRSRALQAQFEATRQHLARLKQLDASLDLSPVARRLLTTVNELDEAELADFVADVAAAEQNVLSAIEQHLDWLEQHAHEWRVEHGELTFTSTGLAEQHASLRAEVDAAMGVLMRDYLTPELIAQSPF